MEGIIDDPPPQARPSSSPTIVAEKVADRVLAAEEYLRLLHPPGSVFEVRLLDASESGGRYSGNFAGFFDDPGKAAEAAVRHDIQFAPRGVYVTINPVQAALLSRIHNRIRKVKRGESASDQHVIQRRWLFIDSDPVREGNVTGIPATDAERAASLARTDDVCDWLMSKWGWHEPLRLDSGNGNYLLFPIDLPNDDKSTDLVTRVLGAIGSQWSDKEVEIDVTVCNASRIARLVATWNRKGDSTPARPHRSCKDLYVPDYLTNGWCDPIPVKKLELVAEIPHASKKNGKNTPKKKSDRRSPRVAVAEAVEEDGSAAQDSGNFQHRLKVEYWLAGRDIEFRPSHTLVDGRECWQIPCPFNPDHGYDAAILQSPDGKTGFHCHHKSCAEFGWQEAKEAIGKPDGDHYDPPLSESRSIARVQNRTELANSERFVKAYRDEVLFVPTHERFRIYDGLRWREDAGKVGVVQRGKEISRQLWHEAADCMTDDTIDFATKSAKHAGIRAMINLAATDLVVDHNKLDADPLVLNVQNGTIDLRTGKLRAHEPKDFLTKLCPVEFDPTAKCPKFDEFLLQVFVTSELVEFVQRLVGYAMTGSVAEQVLPIFWGVGSNGKSTLLTTLQEVLGDYAGQAPQSLLMLKKNEQHPTEIAALFGQRLVVATETEGGCRLAEALVKQLTGGDVISARRMREDFWTFSPTHKLILCTNHRPKVRGTDHGIWRRLLLVPFTQVFEGTRKDKSLPKKLLEERAGILRWGVDGCLAWQAQGLQPPLEVQAATRQYRSSEDVVGRFVADCCVTGSSSFTVKFSDLYARLKTWCDDCGESLPSAKSTGNWLQDNSFERFHSGVVQYRGIGLKA